MGAAKTASFVVKWRMSQMRYLRAAQQYSLCYLCEQRHHLSLPRVFSNSSCGRLQEWVLFTNYKPRWKR